MRNVILLLVCLSSNALAEKPRFGEPGQIVLQEQGQLTVAGPATRYFDREQRELSLAFGADVFVTERVTLGALVGYETNDFRSDADYDVLRTGARVGYAVPLGERFHLWPYAQVTTTFAWLHDQMTFLKLDVAAVAPILFHPAPHFFLGAGPFVSHDMESFSGGGDDDEPWTSYGVVSMLGGYF